MKCKKCGAELANGVLFCRECGTKVESEKKFCHECGTELTDGVKFVQIAEQKLMLKRLLMLMCQNQKKQ